MFFCLSLTSQEIHTGYCGTEVPDNFFETENNNKENFESKYIKQDEKSYFLNNVDFIKLYKGNINEFAIVKKK